MNIPEQQIWGILNFGFDMDFEDVESPFGDNMVTIVSPEESEIFDTLWISEIAIGAASDFALHSGAMSGHHYYIDEERISTGTEGISILDPAQDVAFWPMASYLPDPRDKIKLDEFEQHFRRKAAAVLIDDDALRLLALFYIETVIENSDFDFCQNGRSLAKLTAAHFCEVGANGIYITDRGQRLINSL